MTTTDTLKVVSANTPNKIVRKVRARRKLRALDPDFAGLQEGQGLLSVLPMRGYRTFYNADGRDQRRGGKDTVVLTRNKYPSLGRLSLQISEEVEPTKFGPDRFATAEFFSHPVGAIAAIDLHLNATVMTRHKSHPLVREFRESVHSVARILDLVADEGFIPLITADLNWRVAAPANFITPYDIFRERGLKWHNHNVDAIVWDPEYLDAVDTGVVAKESFGGDHDWLWAELKATQ